MSKKLFIGNIDWKATQEDLKEAFAQFGAIEDAVIITDRGTGRSKGFGFVTFTEDAEADKAVESMNGKEWMGREISVNEARPLQKKF
jgi:RNA recognition motif-containing protein